MMGKTSPARIPAAVLLGMCLAVFVSVSLPSFAAPPIGSTGPLVPCGYAPGRTDVPAEYTVPCNLCHIAVLTINITNYLIYWVAFPAVVILVAIGGIMILIAGPSEERQAAGKKILTTTVIGLIIVFLSWLIVDTAIKVATGNFSAAGTGAFIQDFGPWNQIDPTACPL